MTPVAGREGEAGFTLIEALFAILILVFGLAAIANLFIMASTSNSAANRGTQAAAVAAATMERLKSIPFSQLAAGGNEFGAGVGPTVDCELGNLATTYQCSTVVQAGEVPTPSVVHVEWRIAAAGVPASAPATFFITVVAEPLDAFTAARGRAIFTTFRTRQAAS